MADNKKVETLKKKVRADEKVALAYVNTFNSPDGKIVLKDMMSRCHMLSSTFQGTVKNMLINEGERLMVLRILKMCNINPNKLRERIEKYERDLENDDVV